MTDRNCCLLCSCLQHLPLMFYLAILLLSPTPNVLIFHRLPRGCMFSSAGDLTDKLFLSPAGRKPAGSWHIPAVSSFLTVSHCVRNAAYWHDFILAYIWMLTLHCDPSQDRELRPEEMDGMSHFRKNRENKTLFVTIFSNNFK